MGLDSDRIRTDTAPAGGEPRVDAGLVLEATAALLDRMFTAHRVAGAAQRPQVLRALRRTLDTRWRLEAELLMPALRTACSALCHLAEDAEVGELRALSDRLAPVADPYDERQTALVTLLQAAVRQRCERVDALVESTRRGGRLDLLSLGRSLVQALETWSAEDSAR